MIRAFNSDTGSWENTTLRELPLDGSGEFMIEPESDGQICLNLAGIEFTIIFDDPAHDPEDILSIHSETDGHQIKGYLRRSGIYVWMG